jgi:hypothetical protein
MTGRRNEAAKRRADVAAWKRKAIEGGLWRKLNVGKGIAKLQRKLSNSMAYVGKPEPRDLERWAAWRQEIAELEAVLAALERGEDPPLASPKPDRKDTRRRRREANRAAWAARTRTGRPPKAANDGGDHGPES